MRFLRKKYYTSCELLPLWNFFKVSSTAQLSLKYLIVLPDRFEYESLEVTEQQYKELGPIWDKIFQEYNELDKNYGVVNFINDRSKLLYFYSIYLEEQSLIKSLLYRTNVSYIQLLRRRGYRLRNTSQADYWEDLYNALKRVENHMTQIEMLKNKIEVIDEDSKKEGNPYDTIMAWIASNDIKVEESITVSRYIKIKEIIHSRIKAKNRNKVAA